MKAKKILTIIVLLFIVKCFGQNSFTEIKTKDGVRFITTNINYPITGIYLFNGVEPIVELNDNGTSFYQSHDEPKRAIVWGIECNDSGIPKFIKGFDNSKYTLFYKYTTALEADIDEDWNTADFTIHFNSMKMYIRGERSKSFTLDKDKK